MTYTLPVTEGRKDFLNLVDLVNEEYTRIDFTKMGKVKATMVSPDYLDSLEETVYSWTYSMDDIKEGEKNFKDGEFITLEDIIKRYNKEGISNKKYASKTQGSKKSR